LIDNTDETFMCCFLCLALVLAKPMAAKPSKIVAGHDADKTNELLQALAEAINKKVGNSLL
jgi:TRAF3-interacting protein 1